VEVGANVLVVEVEFEFEFEELYQPHKYVH
jgi:hypothetical protein